MHEAKVTLAGDRVRWVELPGIEPARVYLHGLGATSAAYFAGVATHPLLAEHRSVPVALLGHGISDRPRDFAYSFEAQAEVVAIALQQTGVTGAEMVAHSMGGAAAVTLRPASAPGGRSGAGRCRDRSGPPGDGRVRQQRDRGLHGVRLRRDRVAQGP